MPEDFDTTIAEPVDILESEEISTDAIDISSVDTATDFSEDFSDEMGIGNLEDTEDYLVDMPEDTDIDTLDTGIGDITETFPEDISDSSLYEEMTDVEELPEDVDDGSIDAGSESIDSFFAEDTVAETDTVDGPNDAVIESFVEDTDVEDISVTGENDLNEVNDPDPYDVPDDWEVNDPEFVPPTEQIKDIPPENPEKFMPSEMPEYTPICEDTFDDREPSSTLEDVNAKIDEISNGELSNEHKIESLNQIKDDLLSETAVGDSNDGGPVKVLKRDPLDLLSSGSRNIDDILSIKADDYRDKGYSEEEISSMLANDKIQLQEDFLKDAFPGQDVSPAVFNAFNQEISNQPSLQPDLPANDSSFIEVEDGFDATNGVTASALDINTPETESSDGEPYTARPNSEIQILQPDGSTKTLEQVQRELEESENIPLSDVASYTATPNSEIQILQPDGTVKTLEQVQQELEGSENTPAYDVDPYVAASTSEMADAFTEDTAGDLSAPKLPYPLSDMKTVDDVSGWLSDINPNYDAFDPESPYCNNCGSCAYAVHQRLEGNPDICATENNIGYNSEMEALTGMEQVSMSPSEIEQRLLAEGDGAHAIIGIDRAQGAGHWFNAACLNGKVVAIDGQSGEIMDWPPDYGDVVNWEMSVRKGA